MGHIRTFLLNFSTIHHRLMARFLRKRSWVVFYLEEEVRVCSPGCCWLSIYEAEEGRPMRVCPVCRERYVEVRQGLSGSGASGVGGERQGEADEVRFRPACSCEESQGELPQGEAAGASRGEFRHRPARRGKFRLIR